MVRWLAAAWHSSFSSNGAQTRAGLLSRLVHAVLIGPRGLLELGRFREMASGGFEQAFGRDGIRTRLAHKASRRRGQSGRCHPPHEREKGAAGLFMLAARDTDEAGFRNPACRASCSPAHSAVTG